MRLRGWWWGILMVWGFLHRVGMKEMGEWDELERSSGYMI